MKIGGMGIAELLIILAVALLIFGPKQLPKLGRALGKTVSGFRDGLNKKDSEASSETAKATASLPEQGTEAPRRKKRVAKAPATGAAATTASSASEEAAAAESAPVEATVAEKAGTVA